MSGVAHRRRAWVDVETGGTAVVSGTVTVSPSTPVRRRVLLLEAESLRVRRAAWSDPTTGAYEFTGLAESAEWLVLGLDQTATHNATVKDRVQT